MITVDHNAGTGLDHQPAHKLYRRFSVWGLWLAAALLAGCGQVITLPPTPTPEPTATIAIIVAASTADPTVTPAPYTPAPTVTPTVTPTADIHTVQTGESLLVIANRYDLSVSALQEANGILDPRYLQIGQQLVIPRPQQEDEKSDANPTPTPMAVTVENLHFSDTAVGGLWVLGEVHNTSDTPLEQVRVGITLLDDVDQEIAQSQALVALDLVDVDERAPFAILFSTAPGQFDQYRAYPSSAVPAYVGTYYRDLSVEEVEIDSERYASYTVSGIVRNIGPEEAVSVQVVLTAYDPLGRVVGMRQVDPDHNVVPRGGETTFTAIMAPVGGPVERIEAAAQGRRLRANQ